MLRGIGMMLMLAGVTLSLAKPAAAQFFTFSTETEFTFFNEQLGAITSTEDFESFPTNALIPSGSSSDGVTVTYAIDGESLKVTDAFDTVSGIHSIGLTGGSEALLDGDVINLSFDGIGVFSLGVHVITSDFASLDEIELVTAVGTVRSGVAAQEFLGDGGIVYFLGFLSSNPIKTATLQFANDGQTNFAYNIDDITSGFFPAPVPALSPMSSIAIVMALIGVGTHRLRRRAVQMIDGSTRA